MPAPLGNKNALGNRWKQSKESKEKIRFSKLGTKNPNFGKSAWNKGLKGYMSGEKHWCWKKKRLDITKEKHPNWKGGRDTEYEELIKSSEWKHWREYIFKRDNYRCKNCGTNGCLEPHHIFSIRELIKHNMKQHIFNTENGITLCRPCHQTTINYERD